MNPNAKPKKEEPKRTPLAYKCTSDGKSWAVFEKKTCRYCLPIFEQSELDRLRK